MCDLGMTVKLAQLSSRPVFLLTSWQSSSLKLFTTLPGRGTSGFSERGKGQVRSVTSVSWLWSLK